MGVGAFAAFDLQGPTDRLLCHAERYDSFEGLQAEECGILNGCENGRCVRVREGYTCDCFDGYELDLGKMACIGGFHTADRGGDAGGFNESDQTSGFKM